jgi:hypothetical protein
MKLENKMMKDFQTFTNSFFKNNPPIIEWKNMKNYGEAIWDENKIYINPQMNETMWELEFGEIEYRSQTRLKLSKDEKYFQVLLHEIGHFKIKPKPPKEFIAARRNLQKKWGDDKKLHLEFAGNYLEPKENESGEDYEGRLMGFRHWLATEHTYEEHMQVEEWSIEEFKKQRKRIREIIKNWKE